MQRLVETFIIVEDGKETSRCGRSEVLAANAFDRPILRILMELIEDNISCQRVHSEPRCKENRLKTGRDDPYMYIIKRMNLPMDVTG